MIKAVNNFIAILLISIFGGQNKWYNITCYIKIVFFEIFLLKNQ